MGHDIPFGNSNRENGPTFLDFPLFLGIFQWDEPTKRVPFTAEPEMPEILTKWKAPVVYRQRVLQTVTSLRVVSLLFSGQGLLKIANINPQQEATLSLWKKLVPQESAGNGA